MQSQRLPGAPRGRRIAPSWAPRTIGSVVLGLLAAACDAGGGPDAPDVDVDLAFDPPPCVGETVCTVTLTGSNGAPLEGATIEVEGNMNHAGMVPVFADLRGGAPGAYASDFEFTMGGDWFVVVRGELADGRRVERIFDVPAVPSAPGDSSSSCCTPVER
jgi:hypothetical protein